MQHTSFSKRGFPLKLLLPGAEEGEGDEAREWPRYLSAAGKPVGFFAETTHPVCGPSDALQAPKGPKRSAQSPPRYPIRRLRRADDPNCLRRGVESRWILVPMNPSIIEWSEWGATQLRCSSKHFKRGEDSVKKQ